MHLPGAEQLRIRDGYPQLHDRTTVTPYDNHYFYQSIWASRLIHQSNVKYHIDVGSLVSFVGILSTVTKVVFVDIRPLKTTLKDFSSISGSMLKLPFQNDSIGSLSCLHVAEHIGLGRYGDPLDPLGTKKAIRELARVLAPGGNLYFSLPVGRSRLCFNAHRIHKASTICNYFSNLELVEFSGVYDNGRYVEHVGISEFDNSDYACGFFWFRRKYQ